MEYRMNPCNIQYFDLHACLRENGFVEWKQFNFKYEVGDIVFIYTSAPESRLSYMLVVEEVDIPLEKGFDDSSYLLENSTSRYKGYKDYCGDLVRFRLLKKLSSPALMLKHLQENGLKGSVQGPRKVEGELLHYILLHLI